jgi:hypothetical protein
MNHNINAALLPLFRISEQWFSNALNQFSGELTDNLIEKAESTKSIAVQSDCFTALHSLQKTSNEAIPVFNTTLAQYFQTSKSGQHPEQMVSSDSFPHKGKKETLNLIATNDWEENISFDTAIEKITKQNHEEFNHLEIRIFELLERCGEKIPKSPLATENIIAAFRDSMALFDFSPDIRIHIYKLFEKYLSQKIGVLLKKLNTELISEGILPEIITDYSIKRQKIKKTVSARPESTEAEQMSSDINQPAHFNLESFKQQQYPQGEQPQSSGLNLPINTPVNNIDHNIDIPFNKASAPQESDRHSLFNNSRPQENDVPPVISAVAKPSSSSVTTGRVTSALNDRYLDLARQLSNPSVRLAVGSNSNSPNVDTGISAPTPIPTQSTSIEASSKPAENINSDLNNLYSLNQIYEEKQQKVTAFANEYETTTQELIKALANIQYTSSPDHALQKTPSVSVIEQIKNNILMLADKSPDTTLLKNDKLYLVDMIEDLFAHIADNKKLSSSAKELFRRLMIPIIHLALIDQTFIENENHPARQFLDDFADASLGITDSIDNKNNLIYLKLKKFTRQLGSINKINRSVFVEFNKDLNSFISYRKEHANKNRQTAHSSIRTKINAIVEHCINGEELPDGLVIFLNKIWKNVMLSIYLDKNSNSELRGRASAFISSLIFSIRPAKSPVEKKRLERLIPIINRELTDGLNRINCPKTINDKVTLYLKKLHQTALDITGLQIERNDSCHEEDEVVFRNELFDDSNFTSMSNEPTVRIVSSIEEAFIEEDSTDSLPDESKKEADVPPSGEIVKIAINKLIINKPVFNDPPVVKSSIVKQGKESKTDFELIRLVNNSYKMTVINDGHTSKVKSINEDSWLEFRFKSHYSRARVTWIEDEHRQFNCLTQNNRIIEMSLEALSDSFRQGICSTIQSTSIIDEAIKAVSHAAKLYQ